MSDIITVVSHKQTVVLACINYHHVTTNKTTKQFTKHPSTPTTPNPYATYICIKN